MTAARALRAGDLVAGRYELGEVLGQGTSGTVFAARSVGDADGARVAIKLIHPRHVGDRQIFKRFEREARILSRIGGPHVVKLLDFLEQDGLLVLVLEYVDGPSLEGYLRHHGAVGLDEAIAIALQICAALSRMHAAGVIHRDLKPGNVLVEGFDDWRTTLLPERPDPESARASTGEPKTFRHGLLVRVADFGLAKILQGEGGATALTEQDMIFGTPDYMSPEQVAGDELDARCDLYALCAMLYEMTVGRVPFETPGPLTTMAAQVNQPVPSPRQIAPARNIPESLERVIVRGLCKQREDRYQSADDLATALLAVLHADSVTSAPPHDTSPPDTELSVSSGTTTLQSIDNGAVAKARGAAVRVVVRDAEPALPGSGSQRSGEGGGFDDDALSRPDSLGGVAEATIEQRVWMALAVLAVLVAIAVGIYLGTK